MELTEISDRIDLLLKSFEGGISADEYEKSLQLTEAQKNIYYSLLKVFEQNGIITNVLKPFLVNEISTTAPSSTPVAAIAGGQYFVVPNDIEKIIYETAELDVASDPLLHQRVTRVMATKVAEMSLKQDNPFRAPDKTETLKVISEKTSTENVVELHAIANIGSYSIKYFKTVTPIILENLPDGLTVDGLSAETNTLFNDEVLVQIIENAASAIMRGSVLQKNIQ